jgi:hypothetical protein
VRAQPQRQHVHRQPVGEAVPIQEVRAYNGTIIGYNTIKSKVFSAISVVRMFPDDEFKVLLSAV